MSKKSILSILTLAAVVITFAHSEAKAGFPVPPGFPAPPGVNVRIDGYLPAPPGVHVRIDSGRPYYVERDRRVYIEREPVRRHHKRYYKKHYRSHDRGHGHDRY